MRRGLLLCILIAALLAPGCGAIVRYVGNAIKQDTVERVQTLEEKTEAIAEKIESVAADVEDKVTDAVQAPVVAIIATLFIGGLLTALCIFKFPAAVDEVAIGTIAVCGALLFWAYRKPILWTAVAAGAGLLGWKLLRRYVLPKVLNDDEA
jgi:multidrug efflux pump subunit AcrB